MGIDINDVIQSYEKLNKDFKYWLDTHPNFSNQTTFDAATAITNVKIWLDQIKYEFLNTRRD